MSERRGEGDEGKGHKSPPLQRAPSAPPHKRMAGDQQQLTPSGGEGDRVGSRGRGAIRGRGGGDVLREYSSAMAVELDIMATARITLARSPPGTTVGGW